VETFAPQESEAARAPAANQMKVFILIWAGQFVSLMGSRLTWFALGVWVYQRTGSATQFALIFLFTMLPALLISPVAGALTDRWDRRHVMIMSDTGAGLCTLVIAALLISGRLEVWHIYVMDAISSAFSAFQWPAYSASTTLLVPKKHLGRANGMVQTAQALAQIVSPVVAGALLAVIHLEGIILLDFVTFVFAVTTLLLVRIPRPVTTSETGAGKKSLLRESAEGWHYIVKRRGLFGLLIFFAISNFLVGILSVLATPLVLAFAPVTVLGTVLSIGGGGMLVGSLLMSVWGGPKRRIYGVLGFMMLGSLSMILAGIKPSAVLTSIAAFGFFFGIPIMAGCSQTIWQVKVPPELQGRVFATRAMIAGSCLPLAYLIAGPLADYIFEPLLVVGGPLAGSIGEFIGVGPGRGIGLLFIIIGLLSALATIGGYLYKPVRLVEGELPDAVA
jgi:MFS transporter, DHA3 family, macrolide efflux protein